MSRIHWFCTAPSKSKNVLWAENEISILEILLTSLSTSYLSTLTEYFFQQMFGIHMGKNSAPFLADMFLYSYKAWFIPKFIIDKQLQKLKAFNLTCRYIDHVLSINNSIWISFIFNVWTWDRNSFILTFTSNATQIVNFLPDFMTKEAI